jgi:tRNA threonylcarbamoyl adenosine modification protein (Sua5/YciO/YrdC/YwlC family)
VIPDPLGEAAQWLRGGGLLAYPTETVWGLGADATEQAAVARLLRWKARGPHDPLAILVETVDDLPRLGFEPAPGLSRLAGLFWPGPLTLVLRCSPRFAHGVARADGAVGVRCSSHPLATALARRLRGERVGPITATSLNRSGDPAARTRAEAQRLCGLLDEQPRMLEVRGAETGGDSASTVVDLTGARPVVLRWGAVPSESLMPVLAELTGT